MGLGSSVLPPLIFHSPPSAALFNACQLNSILLPEILSSQHPKKAVIPVYSIRDTRAFRRSLEELIQTPPLPLSVLFWFTPSHPPSDYSLQNPVSQTVFLASISCFKPPYGACSSDSQGCSAQLTDLKYFPALKAQPNNTFSTKPPHSWSRVALQHRQRGWTYSELWLQSGSTWSAVACPYPYIPSQPASQYLCPLLGIPPSFQGPELLV